MSCSILVFTCTELDRLSAVSLVDIGHKEVVLNRFL